MICAHCHAEFKPKREAKYCGNKCRSAAHRQVHPGPGISGQIKAVRRLKSGVSVVVHTRDEASLRLVLGTEINLLEIAA
jgi:hypothetical protein